MNDHVVPNIHPEIHQEILTTRKARLSPFRSRIIGIKGQKKGSKQNEEEEGGGGRKFSQSPIKSPNLPLQQEEEHLVCHLCLEGISGLLSSSVINAAPRSGPSAIAARSAASMMEVKEAANPFECDHLSPSLTFGPYVRFTLRKQNFRWDSHGVLGEILPQWEVALVSGYQKLQSDIGVT